MLGPVLAAERIRLEPARPEHLPVFARWFADPQVTQYLLVRHPLTPKQEEAWFEAIAASQDDVHWAITLRSSGALIGATGLHRISWRDRRAYNGILIGEPSEWGKGHATDAIRLTTGYAFDELGLEKVLTEVYAANEASRRAMEKVGFRQCGLLKRHNFSGGRWHDEWLGEILRGDWTG